ncbi:M50 family metallopeptidase [Demequina mangrovi]|uniref:Peptidase M50B-like n=1 Tax=Demequina mangrovi TaxID=1043493 RepID=A0A1H6XAK4_9MICO|nr:M50 family metallopeptidase [Demequina mangrovi]SEJ26179.1 Peptidase M50B-like [Demequina mangrovi]
MSRAEFLDAIWADVTAVVEPTPRALWISLAVVAVSVAVPFLWHLARHMVTLVHEAGHAVVATLLGREVRGIRLHADTSGLTTSRGDARRLPLAFKAFAGYPAPGVVGLAVAWAVAAGHGVAVLWVAVAVLVAVLMQVRNVYGVLVVVVMGAALGVAAAALDDEWRVGLASGLAWLLMVGGVRAVVELQTSRGRGARGSDADALARLTHVPGAVWVALFWLTSAACLAAGAWLLLGAL